MRITVGFKVRITIKGIGRCMVIIKGTSRVKGVLKITFRCDRFENCGNYS